LYSTGRDSVVATADTESRRHVESRPFAPTFTPMTDTTRPARARFALRAAVWLLAGLLVGGAWSASGLSHSGGFLAAPADEAALDVTATLGTPASVVQAGPLLQAPSASACNPSPAADGTQVTDGTTATGCVSALAAKYCPSADNCDAKELLAPWRWKGSIDLQTQASWYQIDRQLQGGLADLFFNIAGWIWALTFLVANTVLSLDLFNSFGAKINETFVLISDATTSAGLVALVLGFGVFYVVRLVLRGKLTGIFSTAVTMLIPLALFSAIGTAAAGAKDATANVTDRSEATRIVANTPMTPTWLANEGLRYASMPAAAIATQLSSSSRNWEFTAKRQPSCAAYITALMDAFSEAWSRGYGSSRSGDAATMKTLTGVFDENFVSYFIDAQYRGSVSAQRIACHQIESVARIPVAEQVIVGTAAGYPSGTNFASAKSEFSTGIVPTGLCPDGKNCAYRYSPFNDLSNVKGGHNRRQGLLMWGACVYVGGSPSSASSWRVDPAYHAFADTKPDECRMWWTDGFAFPDGTKTLEFENTSLNEQLNAKQSAYATAVAASKGADATVASSVSLPVDNLADVKEVIAAMKGDNTTAGLFYGLFGLLTAVLYLYALGGIFFGLLIAKTGFAILVALLPGILLLMALPSGRKGGMGQRLLKMLFGWLVASVMLSVTLNMFLLVSQLIREMINSNGTGLVSMLAPAISFFLVRTIVKKLGMGDLLHPMGGAAMALGAAASVSGDKTTRGLANSAGKKGVDVPGYGKKKWREHKEGRDREREAAEKAAREAEEAAAKPAVAEAAKELDTAGKLDPAKDLAAGNAALLEALTAIMAAALLAAKEAENVDATNGPRAGLENGVRMRDQETLTDKDDVLDAQAATEDELTTAKTTAQKTAVLEDRAAEMEARAHGIVDPTGANQTLTLNGQPVQAFVRADGTLVTGAELQATVADAFAASLNGALGSADVNGFTALTTAVGVGAAGQNYAAQAVASPMGVDAADVLVSSSAGYACLAPGFAVTGERLDPHGVVVGSYSPTEVVSQLRSFSTALPDTITEKIAAWPAEEQTRFVQLVHASMSSNGIAADGLSARGLTEVQVERAASDPAALAKLLDDHPAVIPTSVLNAAAASLQIDRDATVRNSTAARSAVVQTELVADKYAAEVRTLVKRDVPENTAAFGVELKNLVAANAAWQAATITVDGARRDAPVDVDVVSKVLEGSNARVAEIERILADTRTDEGEKRAELLRIRDLERELADTNHSAHRAVPKNAPRRVRLEFDRLDADAFA
jgi:hypothetical protein